MEMIAEEKDLEDLKNLTQCSICRERYSDPRVLPCLHSFCLDCLQKAGSARHPGDRMPCPLCRKEFVIPEEDFEGLQKDFRLHSLIEMSRLPMAVHRSAAAAAAAGTSEDGDLDGVQKVYCFDCRLAIDVRCYFEKHRTHSCCDIFEAVEGFRRQVQSDEEKALVWEAEALHRSHESDTHKDVLLKQLNLVERRVSRRGDDMRRLVEAHIKALGDELEILRQRKLEEMDVEMDALDKHQLTLRRYRSRCERLKTMEENVSQGDLCRLATELQAEAQRLKRRHDLICIERKLRLPEINFKETPVEGFLTESKNNVVGTLEAQRGSQRRIRGAAQAAATILRLFGLTDLRVLGSVLFGLISAVLVAAGLSIVAGLVAGLIMGVLMLWMLKVLLPKTECLQLLATLRTDGNHASGVTFLRHHLYLILQSPPLVIVYQSESPYSRLRDIPLSRIALPWDIAACNQTNSLYVTDSGNRCVWKVSLEDDRVVSWLKDMDKPHTVFVSSDGRALFVRDGHPRSSLEVYGPDGVLVERIPVPAKVRQPHHAVETCTGTFLLSHGTWIGQTHGLVELTKDGEMVHSYNSTESLWGVLKSITLLLDPSIRRDDVRHLALDSDDRLFVADWFNDRIIRFDSRFRLGQMFRTNSRTAAGWPILRFCYVKETRQMMIVHQTARENRVHVYRIC